MQHHHRGARRHPLTGLAALALLALGACASVPPPTAQLAVSTAALAHAAAAAGQGPAQPELALARDKLRRANLALADKDNRSADRLAQEAQVDALVAESRGETAKARQAAQEVQAAGRALTDELARQKP
jgi:molybdopterin-guanine dinucleotide biosynthesis protein A